MNPEESIEEVEVIAEEKTTEKEKTVCARLVLSDEQLFDQYHSSTRGPLDISLNIFEMEEIYFSTDSAVTAECSVTEINKLLLRAPTINEVSAKLSLTAEQENDLRYAFNLLDYTGEGKIKAEDFRVAIKALGYEPNKEELQTMISAVDKGDTGKLSFENFETAIMRKIMSQDSDGDIMKSFRLFDMDDSGFISFDNLKRVTEILGTYLTDEEIEEMIDDADKDFDGFVSVQEFMKMIKTCVNIVTP